MKFVLLAALFAVFITAVASQGILASQIDLDPEDSEFEYSLYDDDDGTSYDAGRWIGHSFTIPSGTFWNISSFSYEGARTTPTGVKNYYRFLSHNSAAGTPTLEAIDEGLASLFFCLGSSGYGFACSVTLPRTISLGPGTYWFSWGVESNYGKDGIRLGRLRVTYPGTNMAFICGSQYCFILPSSSPSPSLSPSSSPSGTPVPPTPPPEPPRRTLAEEAEVEFRAVREKPAPVLNQWYRDENREGNAVWALLGLVVDAEVDTDGGDANTMDSVLYSSLREML